MAHTITAEPRQPLTRDPLGMRSMIAPQEQPMA